MREVAPAVRVFQDAESYETALPRGEWKRLSRRKRPALVLPFPALVV